MITIYTKPQPGGRIAGRMPAESGHGDQDDVLHALNGHPEANGSIADGRFTAADVPVGSLASRGGQCGTIQANASLAAFWARLEDSPALAAANAKDNALILETKP